MNDEPTDIVVTFGGFNTFLEEQKAAAERARLTLSQFGEGSFGSPPRYYYRLAMGVCVLTLWHEHYRFVLETLRARGVAVVVNLAGGYQGPRTAELHLGTLREAHRVR